MGAPVSVVAAVMEALGCCKVSVEPDPTLARPWCEQHERWWDDRGCPVAVQAADAAWVASLNAAAERAGGAGRAASQQGFLREYVTPAELRRWADESGSGRGQD